MSTDISLIEIDKSFLKSLKELKADIDRLHGCGICSYLREPFLKDREVFWDTVSKRAIYLVKKAAKACNCYNPQDSYAADYFIEGSPEKTPHEAYASWHCQRLYSMGVVETESTTDNPLILNRKKVIVWLIGYLEVVLDGESK